VQKDFNQLSQGDLKSENNLVMEGVPSQFKYQGLATYLVKVSEFIL